MYRLFLFLLVISVVSCTSSPDQKSPDKGKSTETTVAEETTLPEEVASVPNESVDSITPAQLKKLKKYLKAKTADDVTAFIEKLRYAKTDTAVEQAYHEAKPLIERMETEMSTKNPEPSYLIEELSFMEGIFALRPSCQAECTAFTIEFWGKDLKALAKETSGDKDDRFFAMKEFCEGEQYTYSPGWFTYFERTWDYGGGVLVGNNQIFKVLKDSYTFQKETTLFKTDVDQLRSETIGIMGHPVYMYSQEKVVAELDKILKAGILSAKEKKMIQDIKARNLRNNQEEEPLLQFGCESGDCDWGG